MKSWSVSFYATNKGCQIHLLNIACVDDSSHGMCGKYVRKRHCFGGDYQLVSAYVCCPISLTGALNFELLTNICRAICMIEYICHINIAREEQA